MAQRPSVEAGRKGDELAAQGRGQPQLSSFEGHAVAGLHPPNRVIGPVGQWRQLGRIGTVTDVVATGGHRQG